MSEFLGNYSDNPEDGQDKQDSLPRSPFPYFSEIKKGLYSFSPPISSTTPEQIPASGETLVEPELHICPECSSDLVYPVTWEEYEKQGSDDCVWHIYLRCPNCEWCGDGEYSDSVADRFDDALNEGNEILFSALIKLRRSNMEEYEDRFTKALENDHIMPMDF